MSYRVKSTTLVATAAMLCLFASVAANAATPRDGGNIPHGPAPAEVSVCFVPAQNCVDSIVEQINKSQHTIRVQAYGFTSAAIIKAILKAKQRGVDVQVILDKSNDRGHTADGEDKPVSATAKSRYSGATTLYNASIPVSIDYLPAIAHIKAIIIDDFLVIGGSYNYTTSAENRNSENVTFIASQPVAEWFTQNWETRKSVSRAYQP